ncbi:penicillin-binding protein 2 [Bacillus shivajii]|uniref:peptidoglycan D,D-transpeptidase FtsI family protein n=1 Tax=Bacillus shivajii TaxID=1983719 RepID=UPI001CFA47F0|nr:penicillin-binding protein 2 [Bacillus shivajii]UCZ54546.1 penicillin-binding protein 2 [Bacillus shivajii]
MTEKKNKKSHLPVRLNIIFFLVFLLFSALILRLGVVQIVQGEEYQEQLERTVNISVPVEAPRGLMYDRYGNILVDNELLFTVTYTNRRTLPSEMLETAKKLNEYITQEPRNIYDREIREFWGLLHSDSEDGELSEFDELLTIEDASEQEIPMDEIYDRRLALIPDEEIERLKESEEDMHVFGIWREFIAGYNNLPHKVKRGISYESAAQIMENLEDLPGVDIIRDSRRLNVFDDTLSGIIGNVGSIRRDDLDYYLSQGYRRNEEVGTSFLEAQYESVLRGEKGSLDNFLDREGNFLRNPEEQLGSRGNDLVLTFDIELQQKVEEIVNREVEAVASEFVGDPDAYVVMMEPHTGEVLSIARYKRDETGTITSAFEMGSTIKGATVLAGYDSGALPPGSRILDRPIDLPQTPLIRSHQRLGYINDLQALERSSNIYMTYVAMNLVNYTPGVSGTNWNISKVYDTYDYLRNYYNQFGLGVHTGIDLPSEAVGIDGGYQAPGNLLYLTFGQFDTYTTMQLTQYVATLANGGYRIAPRVVREIREPGKDRGELGPISQQMKPKVLNTVDTNDEYLDRVKEGFRLVMHGSNGTARSFFNDADYEVGGKTGTAQVSVNGEKANNQALVGFAPFDEPEVVFSVLAPGMDRTTQARLANTIGRQILDAYFDLKEQRRGPVLPEHNRDYEDDNVDFDEMDD